MKKEDFEKNYPEKKPIFRSETKWKILDLSENEFISVSQLQQRLNISYKNIIVNLNDLEKDEKIMRLSLDEPSNITYIIPLSITEFFTDFKELEKKFTSIANLSKTITIDFPLKDNDETSINNVTSEARNILILKRNKFPDVKLRIHYEPHRTNRYKIIIKLEPRKLTPILKPKLKLMDKNQREKIKFDFNGFINLYNN
jgi:hypothetical protein